MARWTLCLITPKPSRDEDNFFNVATRCAVGVSCIVAFGSFASSQTQSTEVCFSPKALNRCAIVRQAACLKSTLTSAKDLNDEPL
jgi:hypothetical protein